jgi:1-pyrroline-5-carboxylate dehydrogenase
MSFRLTYATMFDPPEEMHTRFEAALQKVEGGLGHKHTLYVDGRDRGTDHYAANLSPIDQDLVLGEFAMASGQDVEDAMAAAARAFPAWRATPLAERVRLMKKVGDLLEARVYEIAAALTLEVGKNRMEALGEAQETVDFFHGYAEDFEKNGGYDRVLPDDPLTNAVSHNRSILRPHGVWIVISPFNFPIALAGGPTAAALVTGNTVVLKGASDTPWAVRLLADCIRDAGVPDGVFNCLLGSGGATGQAMVDHPLTAGATFTGSVEVGMSVVRKLAGGRYPRPCIAEMGGKNPTIVTDTADLSRAATGIVRSAYGMGGQKCSATSRLYVHEKVADDLAGKLEAEIGKIRIGDPRRRENWLGPVVNRRAHEAYVGYVDELRTGGATLRSGGGQSSGEGLNRGFYVEPVLAEAPLEHRLWKHEMFLPILMVSRWRDREDAMRLANDTDMGLTAGFYGAPDEIGWFQEGIQAGVTYANRGQGATTGAWPGYQPFGGWKGSGSTGKAIGSFYYLPQYMREQSRTVVE